MEPGGLPAPPEAEERPGQVPPRAEPALPTPPSGASRLRRQEKMDSCELSPRPWSSLTMAPGSSRRGPLHHPSGPGPSVHRERGPCPADGSRNHSPHDRRGLDPFKPSARPLGPGSPQLLTAWLGGRTVSSSPSSRRGTGRQGPTAGPAWVSDRPRALLAPFEGVRVGRQDSRGRNKHGLPTPLSAQRPAHFCHGQYCHSKCPGHLPTWCMSACQPGMISVCRWPR